MRTDSFCGRRVGVPSGSGTDEDRGMDELTLTPGTYYLVETDAPAGYNKLEKPVTVKVEENESGKVTITCSSSEVEVTQKDGEPVLTFRLPNTNSFVLPESGGTGTVVYLAAGLLLIFGSVIFLVLKNRLNHDR